MRRSGPGAAALALALLSGCAHAAARPIPEAPRPAWPAPPAAARLRWEGWVATRPLREPSWWERVLGAVTGTEPGGAAPVLRRPFGLAAEGDTLLVADPDGPSVLSVNWQSGTSSEIPCPSHPWEAPIAVAQDASGNRYVADGPAVFRITPEGECRKLPVALQRPTGLAVAASRLYVADPPAHAVVVLSLEGRELFRFGRRGEGEGEFNFPTGIAAQPGGTLAVVDALNFRIVRVTLEGSWLGSFGEAGDEEGQFGRPKGVAADGRGNLYVSDAQWDVVLVFDREGRFQYAAGEEGDGPGELRFPAGLAVSGDRLFVADALNRRLQQFQIVEGHS
ncbi:6-bladed beta-propeller [Anaeromyxobacter paludicola]|uniref:NHL repeat protein n=1 Tax=Anaeromyxobacter paludicola TaxID=2918171 RepID=A0ABM7X6I8_9BACT|nr:6-bladed beta-propeller [Anaeromyxobacter paludicola]BDG07408.1 hypothetical protein AMPC_05210 [Anaeromyxobacter paludicola]